MVYHGTVFENEEDYYIFDEDLQGQGSGSTGDAIGFHFTNDINMAKRYAGDDQNINQPKNQAWSKTKDEFGNTPAVGAFYLNLKNPIILENHREIKAYWESNAIAEVVNKTKKGEYSIEYLKEYLEDGYAYELKLSDTQLQFIIEFFEKSGLPDGIIIEGADWDDYNKSLNDQYIVFSPTQIKSATDNIGTFDGNNPDIRYSVTDNTELSNLYDSTQNSTMLTEETKKK